MCLYVVTEIEIVMKRLMVIDGNFLLLCWYSAEKRVVEHTRDIAVYTLELWSK